jgi:hypothetical protein
VAEFHVSAYLFLLLLPHDVSLQLARCFVSCLADTDARVHSLLLTHTHTLVSLSCSWISLDSHKLHHWFIWCASCCGHAGGSGKTVMARLLFNRLAPRFLHRAFIRLNPEDGSRELQQHLVAALEGLGAAKFNKQQDAAQLLNVLAEFVRKRSVLLVVDNVWTAEQLDGLLPAALGPGSKVIITSRFKSLRGSRHYQVLQYSCTGNANSLIQRVGRADVAT